MLFRKSDKKIVADACKMLSAICKTYETCKGCPFEKEDKEGMFDCILEKPPAEFDIDEITKCFT